MCCNTTGANEHGLLWWKSVVFQLKGHFEMVDRGLARICTPYLHQVLSTILGKQLKISLHHLINQITESMRTNCSSQVYLISTLVLSNPYTRHIWSPIKRILTLLTEIYSRMNNYPIYFYFFRFGQVGLKISPQSLTYNESFYVYFLRSWVNW